MSLAPITLTTDKSTAVIDNAHRRLRQDESGLSLAVTVLNEDNVAYDLTGKSLVFCENKQNNKIIVDNGKGDNAGKFNRSSDNDAKGIFTYVLQEDVYTASGMAWFEITDGTTVDSTKNFYFDVEKDADISFSNNDYIGSLKALETAMAGAEGKITSDLADMEAQIIKKIADGQSLIKNAESSTQSSIDSLNGKINQTISKSQQDIANSLAETKATNDGKIIQALKDLTDQTTAALSNVDEYTKKLATLQSQWDSELQSIKNKAGTDTDSAVKAINDRYTNDFAKIKSDFANWQNSTTQNYQKQVDDILAQLQKNGTEVADVQKRVNDTIAKMQTLTQQFSKIDFTQYAHKDEVNALMGQKITFVKCDSPQAAADASSKPASDGSIVLGIYDMNDEPSQAVVGDQKINIEWLYNHLTGLQSQVSGLSGLQSLINGKADSATVYTKIQVDQMIAQAGKVKTVNHASPDESGNIQIDTNQSQIAQLQQQCSSLQGKVNGKANSSDITNLSGRIDTNQSQITQAQQDIIALQSATSNLSGYETTADAGTLAGRITALENKKPIKARSQNDAVAKSQSSNDEYYW